MSKDLGTYHVRVEFADGRGYIQRFNTGARYMYGTESVSPIGAERISPTWDSEEDLISSVVFIYTEGNYSCDCNKSIFLAESIQDKHAHEMDCGDTLTLKRLTIIRPDGSEAEIWSGQ